MIIVAIDPGKTSSFARFDTTSPQHIEIGEVAQLGAGRLIRPCPMHLAEIAAGADAAVVEEVGARPMQGVSSVFTFGLALGSILGALSALRIPVTMVTPQDWKRASRLGSIDKDEAKDAARAFARELWPEHEKILRAKGKHGMAEAALMARWFFLSGPGRDVGIDASATIRSQRAA